MLNGCPVIERYNALIARAPVAAVQLSFCERCQNRGAWLEQIDGLEHLRRVICACGSWYAAGNVPTKQVASFSEKTEPKQASSAAGR
jgi:hypothetical protein